MSNVDNVKKEEKKGLKEDINDHRENEDQYLDGKGLHDLYRHTTKLMK